MSFFTDSEKIEYALKYALNVTMQNKSLSPYAEEKAPKRIFPRNIMSKDLIEKDKGDIDADGKYLQESFKSNKDDPLKKITADLKDPQSTIEVYKIVDPSTNVVSNVMVRDILTNPTIVGMKQATILSKSESLSALEATTLNYTQQYRKKWFFRGHYGDIADATKKFQNATDNYNGLNLAYSHIASGTQLSVDSNGDLSDNQVATHIKLYLQVQTQNIAAGRDSTGDVDNISFRHPSMENILGLESGFTNVVPVQGPKYIGDDGVLPIIQTGEMGNEWFTQDTYGMLSFYALGSGGKTLVSETPEPDTADVATTGAPLISFLRYVGETASTTGIGGGGGGTGGGGTGSGVNLTEFTGGPIVRSDGNSVNKPTNILAMLEDNYNAENAQKIGTENVMDLSLNLTGDLKLLGDGSTGGNIRLPDSGKIYIGTSEAVFSNWQTKSSDIYKDSKVGIGDFSSDTIDAPLHVIGNLKLTGAIECSNTGTTDDVLIKTDNGMEWGTIEGKWSDATTTNDICYSTGKVGIGTTSPNSLFDIHKAHTSDGLYESDGVRFSTSAADTDGGTWNWSLGYIGGYHKAGVYGNTSGFPGGIVFKTKLANGDADHNLNDSMVIDANGNVGIGMTSPCTELSILCSEDGGLSLLRKGHNFDPVTGLSHHWRIFNNYHNILMFTNWDDDDNERPSCKNVLCLRDNGSVGIGTASPNAKLQVLGTSINPSTSTQSATSQGIMRLSGSGGYHIDFGFQASSPFGGWIQTHNGSTDGVGDDLLLQPVSGNVGIGTTSTDAKLHIHTTPNVANYDVPQILITTDPPNNYNQYASLELRGGYDGDTVQYGVGIRTTHGWNSSESGRNYGDFNIYTTDKDNGNARTDRLTVTSEGNVGIGTTRASASLDVRGNANFHTYTMLVSEFGTNAGIIKFINWTKAINDHELWNEGGDHRIRVDGSLTTLYNNTYERTSGQPLPDTYDYTHINSGVYFYATWALPTQDVLNKILALIPSSVTFEDGNVGIGTSTPSDLLNVYSSSNAAVFINKDDATFSKILNYGELWLKGGDTSNEILLRTNGNDSYFLNTNVGIGTSSPSYSLDIAYNGINNHGFRVTGSTRTITITNDEINCSDGLYLNYNGNDVYSTGNNKISSDNRIKHNEKPLSNALEIINKLKPQKYFKSFKMYDENHHYELDSNENPITNDKFSIETGFIAQDIQLIPELSYLVKEIPDKSYTEEIDVLDENGERVMVEDENGGKIPKKEMKTISRPSRLSLSYNDIFVYHIKATQELDKKVATLESELAAIKSHLGI